jgi:hypothetical protein
MRHSFALVVLLAACGGAASVEETGQPLVEPPTDPSIDFQVGWTQVQRGAIVRGGHFVVDFALPRLDTCRATGEEGRRLWTLNAWVRFDPGGETFIESVVSDGSGGVPPDIAVPARFEVPLDASSVEIWFRNESPDCLAWDSDFSRNYRFPVLAAAPPPVGWVGDWGSSTNRDCQHVPGIPEPITIDEYMRERACIYVDGDVWVPGVTDGSSPHPEWIFSQVGLTVDANSPSYSPLDLVGRVGSNERFRFQVPYELRNLTDWNTASYTLRFSTDGTNWTDGPTHTFVRAFPAQ